MKALQANQKIKIANQHFFDVAATHGTWHSRFARLMKKLSSCQKIKLQKISTKFCCKGTLKSKRLKATSPEKLD